MTMPDAKFVVVENAGYIGETDGPSFASICDAWDYIAETYGEDERDPFHTNCLHVDIRQDWTDEDGTEHQEYVY